MSNVTGFPVSEWPKILSPAFKGDFPVFFPNNRPRLVILGSIRPVIDQAPATPAFYPKPGRTFSRGISLDPARVVPGTRRVFV